MLKDVNDANDANNMQNSYTGRAPSRQSLITAFSAILYASV